VDCGEVVDKWEERARPTAEAAEQWLERGWIIVVEADCKLKSATFSLGPID